MLEAQKQRLDAQEAAQKAMSRKLEVMENGFSAMHSILYPRQDDPDSSSAHENRIPSLEALDTSRINALTSFEAQVMGFQSPLPASTTPAPTLPAHGQSTPHPPSRPAPTIPPAASQPIDAPEPVATTNFDTAPPFPPPATNDGPYTSPLHHLLSMHESLRDELARVSTGLSELDGRHSMQILNENLRTREEISYLGAQLAALSRQVHWLTSSQLQRQQQQVSSSSSRSGTPSAVTAGPSDVAGASAGVDSAVSAVSTAATALRGAARVVNVGQGLRRGLSEEGKTKL